MFRLVHLVLLAGIVLCLGLIVFLRRDYAEPNYELLLEEQMSRSPAFRAYSPNPNFKDGLTLRAPAPGTIPQGGKPWAYDASPADAVRAGKELRQPLQASAEERQRGALLYKTNCQCCHGETGLGDGPVSRYGFPAPLSFLTSQALQMQDGEMFHLLTYGKGNMPAHSLQLSAAERWSVILHVRFLQKKLTVPPDIRLADTINLYKSHCFACHGEDGTGNLYRARQPTIPDFTSLAWQLSQTNLEIINRIEYGDEPLMPSFRYQLPRDQIIGLSIYVRSFAIKSDRGSGPTPLPVPTPLPKAANLTAVQIFRAYCLACHNVDGRGAIVRPGMPDIPDFTLSSWQQSKKDEELSKAILSGGKYMPPMKDKLAPADAARMVAYVRAFKDGKQVVEPEKQEVPVVSAKVGKTPPPITEDKKPLKEVSPETANRLRAAAVLFRQYCLVCHGPEGTGSAMRAALPALPDFTNVSFHRQHSDPQLLISILDGKGTLMPANRGRITETQARDLVAYLRAFAPGAVEAAALPPSEFRTEFERLQQEWEALERAAKKVQAVPQPPQP
jgi:mono/diheme cytochrome c family protein